MSSVAYSAKAIAALPDPIPPRRQQEHSVRDQKNLLIVAGRGGTRTWFLRYQIRGRRRKMKLGEFPAMSLSKAAKKAERLRYDIKQNGTDPMGEPPEEGVTFGELAGIYLKARSEGQQRLRPATLKEWRRILASPELANLRAMAPADITDRHVARCLDPYEKRDALVMMNRVQEVISSLMEWGAIRRRYGIESNPVRGMKPRYQEAPKERYLDADEIATVWRDLEGRPPLPRACLRLILLTGQRPGEVRQMRWQHIDGSTWKMPAGYRKRTRADKGKPSRPHDVHLTPFALTELERIRGHERAGFVFPNRSNLPIDKDGLARVVARMCSRLDMERWTPHDLRRTARTMWTDHGADWVVAEKIVGHRLPQILRTYDRSVQWTQRVDVLERWSEYVALQVEAATEA